MLGQNSTAGLFTDAFSFIQSQKSKKLLRKAIDDITTSFAEGNIPVRPASFFTLSLQTLLGHPSDSVDTASSIPFVYILGSTVTRVPFEVLESQIANVLSVLIKTVPISDAHYDVDEIRTFNSVLFALDKIFFLAAHSKKFSRVLHREKILLSLLSVLINSSVEPVDAVRRKASRVLLKYMDTARALPQSVRTFVSQNIVAILEQTLKAADYAKLDRLLVFLRSVIPHLTNDFILDLLSGRLLVLLSQFKKEKDAAKRRAKRHGGIGQVKTLESVVKNIIRAIAKCVEHLSGDEGVDIDIESLNKILREVNINTTPPLETVIVYHRIGTYLSHKLQVADSNSEFSNFYFNTFGTNTVKTCLLALYKSDPSGGRRETEAILMHSKSIISEFFRFESSKIPESFVDECADIFSKSLKSKFKGHLGVNMVLTSHFISESARHGKILPELIKQVAAFRGVPEYAREFSTSMASIVSGIKVRNLLSIFPLSLDGESGVVNDWIIPHLSKSVGSDELSVFTEMILPFVEECDALVSNRRRRGTLDVGTIRLENTANSLFHLLVRFADNPSDDISKSFGPIYAYITRYLKNTNSKRFEASWTFLHTIIESLYRRRHVDMNAQGNVKYLSTFFSEEIFREAISVYVESRSQVCKSAIAASLLILRRRNELIEEYLLDIFGYIQKWSNGGSGALVDVYLELVEMFVEYLPDDHLGDVVVLLNEFVDPSSAEKYRGEAYEKASYKILLRLASSHTGYVLSNIGTFLSMLVNYDENVEQILEIPHNVRKYRFRALSKIIDILMSSRDAQMLDVVHQIISGVALELVHGLKEVNRKARDSARVLIVSIYGEFSAYPELRAKLVSSFVAMLGVSDPWMVSGGVSALGEVYRHVGDAENEFEGIAETVILLFKKTQHRSVKKSVLDFFRRLSGKKLVKFDHFLSVVTEALSWDQQEKNHFKRRIDVLIERWIKRYGVEKVSEVFPKEHAALLRKISKEMKKRERAKEQKRVEKVKSKRARQDAIDKIEQLERVSGDPIDLLEGAALQHVADEGESSSSDEFDVDAKTGKIIIGYRRRKEIDDSDSDSDDESMHFESESEEVGAGGESKGGASVRRTRNLPTRKGVKDFFLESGERFKNQKDGRGDNVKDGVKPYAYIPDLESAGRKGKAQRMDVLKGILKSGKKRSKKKRRVFRP